MNTNEINQTIYIECMHINDVKNILDISNKELKN